MSMTSHMLAVERQGQPGTSRGSPHISGWPPSSAWRRRPQQRPSSAGPSCKTKLHAITPPELPTRAKEAGTPPSDKLVWVLPPPCVVA